ncbi:Txe/YoeB family addiction module toxin [Rickettsia sp. 2024-CO-Wats]|uniref:Txe/YoeB family addiction module toxin n=1 Tax=unclassified Rickettsia TaxID=114295 RepID=UPI00370D4E3D
MGKNTILKNIQEAPFTGIGKHEPLKHILSILWSRRINHEHRLIYSVNTKQIIIYNCRFHYKYLFLEITDFTIAFI